MLDDFVKDYEAEYLIASNNNNSFDRELELNVIRRDGMKMSCYGCCMTDYNVWDYPKLKILKQEGILYFNDPSRIRFWFRSGEEVR